jgi:hypothetical protein
LNYANLDKTKLWFLTLAYGNFKRFFPPSNYTTHIELEGFSVCFVVVLVAIRQRKAILLVNLTAPIDWLIVLQKIRRFANHWKTSHPCGRSHFQQYRWGDEIVHPD